ncbi:MAG: DHH family phosphoesterase [Candidatus Nealsonbacteria bacterium]|nr:DHH family phosphoesterase [Candidatus Nealsonbacteria bacterium]
MSKIKNLEKLARRLVKAIGAKERIVLYADSDLDGTVALLILREAILNLGGRIEKLYFSDRRREEPGLNKEALERLKVAAPALLVVLDCGISNFEEARLAKKMGFEVVMIEHHEILDRLPEAAIIVNPKQNKKEETFYHLATCGIVLRLAEELLRGRLTRELREDFLEMASLATVADMVPETGDNKNIIEEGLPLLESSWRPGLQVLLNSSVVEGCLSTRQAVRKVINIVNITDKDGDLSELYWLLTASSLPEAEERFHRFLQKGAARQVEIEKWSDEFKKDLFLKIKNETIIFEGRADLPQPLLGTITSRLCDFFGKPSFIYKKTAKENVGHFRMPEGLSGIEALSRCAQLLRRYGGHAPAGGFYFQEKDTLKLKQCLIKYFQKK